MTTQTDASPFKAQALRNNSPSSVTVVPPQRHFNYELNRQEETIQAEIPTKKFVERKHLRTDKFEYERNGDDPGLILIFNQETFDDVTLGTRKGSRRDINEITVCFQRQGFNVEFNNIMSDGTTYDIKEKLRSVATMDFAKYNSLIIFFLSHGDEFNRLHTKDGTIGAEEIWSEFKNSKNLSNKPKMFVFQACKGEGFSTTGTGKNSSPSSSPNSVITTSKTFSTDHLYSDLLIVYSSIEGNSSFRNSITGSWFIQELCKNFSAYGKRDDVISMLIRTTKCVCGNYYHSIQTLKESVDKKQMPFFVSTLKKKFYLNRNKERDIIIRIAESNEEILKTMREIKNQLSLLLDEDKKKKK